MKSEFSGFSKNTLTFLKNLEANNTKPWFEAHRQEYEAYLRQPLQALAADLGDFMLRIDPYFEVTPNRAVSRIYRDTRFARDKSPYKTTMWITFKHPNPNWQDAPAYFFELAADSYRYGMGFYSASKQTMDKLRDQIDQEPDKFRQAISFYAGQQMFVVEGDTYKKQPPNPKPPEIMEWYWRKNLYLVCNCPINDRLFNRALLTDLMDGFKLLAPLYHYLWRIND